MYEAILALAVSGVPLDEAITLATVASETDGLNNMLQWLHRKPDVLKDADPEAVAKFTRAIGLTNELSHQLFSKLSSTGARWTR